MTCYKLAASVLKTGDSFCSFDAENFVPDSMVPAQSLNNPNFVLVQFDDLGFADFQTMGFGIARTPWINRIAREGLSAERYFTGSTVCSPSRYSIATGRDSAEDGVFTTISPIDSTNFQYNNIEGIPINVPTIYSELKALGYKTAHHGKWHMGLDPAMMDQLGYGLDEYSGWAFHNPGTPNPADQALIQSDRLQWEQTRDQLMTDRSCDFIRASADAGDKFFLNLSFHAPHFPLYPSAAGMAAVAHLDGSQLFNNLDPSDLRTTSAQRYYASIWDADKRIGELYTCLNQRGVLDNTVFIITADNGPLTNRNHTASPDQWGRVGSFRGAKNTTYNGGLRVPFIARGPTIPAGYEPQKATFSAVDVMPTLVDMAGGNAANVDGEVMTQRLQGQDVDRTKPLHWLTIQNLPISMHICDRSPTIRGYYPAGTVGNVAHNVYNNPADSDWGLRPEVYANEDYPEMNNLYQHQTYSCDQIKSDLINHNLAWYSALQNPRLKVNAGRLEYRL